MSTVTQLFAEALAKYPDRPFIRAATVDSASARELRWSYAETARVVATQLAELQPLLRTAGEHVLLYLDEPLPSLFFMLAATHAGAVPVPMPGSFSPDALRRVGELVGARLCFTTPAQAATVASLGLTPLVYDGGGVPSEARALSMTPRLDVAAARAALAAASSRFGPEDVYVLQPTSGTTGTPKLIVRPHRAFVRSARVKAAGLTAEGTPQERVLLVCALTHGMGQYLTAMALYLAGELVIPSRINVQTPLDEVRRFDPTYLCMPPRVLRELLRQHEATGGAGTLFGPGARTYWTGGAATEPAQLRMLHEQGLDVIESYGASEVGLVAVTPRGRWREGLVGEICADVTMRIDPDGEMLFRSPSVMLEYFGDPTLTRAAFAEDGYYRSGDYGELMPDGWLRYRGRKKDIFNSSEGTNIHPTRIEELIEQLPWAQQAILVGDQKPHLGAFVVVKDAPAGADGYLSPAEHPELYARARQDLQRMNAPLEEIERVRRIALFGRPFDAELYKLVGHAKVSRNRPAVARVLAAHLARFYAPGANPAETV